MRPALDRDAGRPREGGFTLVELLTVVAIVAIMAAVAIPQIARYIRNYQIKAAQAQVAGDINTARAKAIMRNVNYGVVFAVLNSTQYQWIIEDIPQQHTRCRASETIPCTWERRDPTQALENSQHGPVQTLPGQVIFGTGCVNGAVTFAGNDSGFRFNRLGAWCDPLASSTAEPCPDLDSNFMPSAVMNDSTNGTLICLLDQRTGIKKMVTVDVGGRVGQP